MNKAQQLNKLDIFGPGAARLPFDTCGGEVTLNEAGFWLTGGKYRAAGAPAGTPFDPFPAGHSLHYSAEHNLWCWRITAEVEA